MFKATGDDLGPKFLKIFGLKKKKKAFPVALQAFQSWSYLHMYIYIFNASNTRELVWQTNSHSKA